MLKFSLASVVENNNHRELSTHGEYIEVAYVSADTFASDDTHIRNSGIRELTRFTTSEISTTIFNLYFSEEEGLGLLALVFSFSVVIRSQKQL